jgi:hypothetical protein
MFRFLLFLLLLLLSFWIFVSFGTTIDSDGVCNIVAILPLTMYGSDHRIVQWKDDDDTHETIAMINTNNNIGYSHFASLEMALRHFNERNTIIVPDILDSTTTNHDICNITMIIVKYIDSQSGGHSAAEQLMTFLLNHSTKVCAIIGPSEELPIHEISTIAQTFDIPTLAYGGMTMRLVDSQYHPYTTRTSSDANSIAYAIVDYIVRVHNRTNYIVILYPQQTQDNVQQHELLTKHIRDFNVTDFSSLSYIAISNGEQQASISIHEACRQIRLYGYQTIITIFSNPQDELPILSNAAHSAGLLNGDYFWMLTGESTQLSAFQNFTNKEYQQMTNLLSGAAFVTSLDSQIDDDVVNNDDNKNSKLDDPYHLAWKSQGENVVNTINQRYPIQVSTDPGYYQGSSNYFRDLDPVEGTGYLYDAVMAVGLGACRAIMMTSTTNNTNTSVRHNSSTNLTSLQHFHGIRNVTFQGSSGIVSFGQATDFFPGSRLVSGLTFGAYNFKGSEWAIQNNVSILGGKDL